MKTTQFVAALVVGVAFSVSADTTYTSESAFVAALQPGYYHEDFSSLSPFNGTAFSSLSFSGGSPSVSYQITADPSGLFVNNDSGFNAVGNWNSADDVTVSFTSPNVYAVGAEFYLNNLSGANQSGPITITFSDGTTGTATSSASGPYGFFGVVATTPITSMTISHDANYFLNIANLFSAATPVPEPATGLMLLIGIIGSACVRRRP